MSFHIISFTVVPNQAFSSMIQAFVVEVDEEFPNQPNFIKRKHFFKKKVVKQNCKQYASMF